MLKFRNRTHVSITPRAYKFPNGTKVAWRSDNTQFHNFVGAVQAYATANGFAVPSSEEIEDAMCKQSPRRDCTGDTGYHQTTPIGQRAMQPAKKCCGRK